MRTAIIGLSLSLALAAPALLGGSNSLALCVLNETAAPGGVAQLKLVATDPKPITSGDMQFAFDPAVFADVLGITVFSGAGDASGLAVYDGARLSLRFSSPLASVGLAKDYPFMVAALAVRPDAIRGTKTPLRIDLASSLFFDALGQPYLDTLNPGELIVSGSVSIRDVLPGGGMVSAGTPITIHGIGFQPGAVVKIGYAVVTPSDPVTPNRIQISAPALMQLDGALVEVVNPDGSSDTYYSYRRGQWLGRSSNPLIAPVAPIFSSLTLMQASFGPMRAGGADYDSLAGLALQNPGSSPAVVTVEVRTGESLLGRSSLVLAPGLRIVREITEYVGGFSPVAGATVTVNSTQPLQMLGIAGDAAARSLVPLQPSPADPE